MANLVFDFLHSYETGERRESEPANAYQYDEGHVLEAVLPSAVTSCEIHYWIRGQEKSEAYTPGSITQNDDGSCTVIGNIPNLYFETNGELRVYIVVTDGSASITTYEGYVHICQRSMPDDYVDDDPENEATRVLTEAREAAATATAAAETCEEVLKSIPEDYSQLSEDVDTLKDGLTAVESDVTDLKEDIGDLNSLTTTDKTSLVNAINESASSGNGLDDEAQELLMDILRNAIYASDQSNNIDALEYNLSGGLQKYNITYNLINSNSSNTKTRISESKSYTTTITAESGYLLLSVTVMMGSTDITSTAYSNGVVTIAEVTGDIVISATSDEAMTFLKSVNLANGAYIDTEYIPASLDDQIIMGVMLMGEATAEKPFAGVTRLPSSTSGVEEYTEYVWDTGSPTAYAGTRISAKVGAYRNPSIIITTLMTVNGNYNPYDIITSVPFYISVKNGEQKLRANMDLTESLVTNSFNVVNATNAYTSTAAMPIDSIYLGAVHDAGSRTTPNQYTAGVKFYGFRVYNENGDLAVDMNPAIRGSSIGMYDMARGKFYTATNGTVGTDITYDEV